MVRLLVERAISALGYVGRLAIRLGHGNPRLSASYLTLNHFSDANRRWIDRTGGASFVDVRPRTMRGDPWAGWLHLRRERW